MRVLGLSAYYHDSAAALVVDGVATAAAQEERFSRKKHDSRFPQHAVRYCLESQGLTLAVIQGMAVCDVAMAGLALAVAESEGLGQVVDLDGC